MTLRRIRTERVDIEDIDPSAMSILDLDVPTEISDPGDVEWVCGHCDETLLHRASVATHEKIVLRCPHCFRFSQILQVQ